MKSESNYFIHNAFVVNELEVFCADVLVQNGRIAKICKNCNPVADVQSGNDAVFIDATGKYLLPGVIDAHVHFREPGLTYKGDLFSESRAAAAGGVTSVMDMPNVIPPTTTVERCKERLRLAKKNMFTNYSFYLGASDNNLDELKKIDRTICGIKLFMGASTGNLLVEKEAALEDIFRLKNIPIAVHCEDGHIIKSNMQQAKRAYGEHIPIEQHAEIRSEEACFLSTQKAVALAQKYGTQLHVLHLSTAKELELFSQSYPKITAEACVSYLCLDKTDYQRLGTRMKCNPSIKNASDREALLQAVISGKIASIASDHAPHTAEEKNNPYSLAPSGLPMAAHILPLMLEFCHEKKLSIETLVERMCHAPAQIFNVKERGFIKEGFFADLVLVDLNTETKIEPETIYYKCGWSPFEGKILHSRIEKTFVNGELAYDNGQFTHSPQGMPLEFVRENVK
ncbi:MAG: dihydroorotase [Lentimicrobiaceae bacterium]|nr:dihydroorotase [Lentimicrobiaceae bacterium]